MTVEETYKEPSFKAHELRCFDAVVRLRSFQAAARALGRTHPSVFASVARLEGRLGFALLDRSGYRVELTPAGRMFHERVADTLRDLQNLDMYARQLRQGEEPVLRVVIGDLCPRSLVLPTLSSFFAGRPRTRLHIDYEAVGGPAQRLRTNTADVVFHRVEPSDLAFDHIPLREVRLIPVAAPGFLPFAIDDSLRADRLQGFMQCVIRDTSTGEVSEQHFLVDGSDRCSVPDHGMKKELILNRLAWGHLPDFLVGEELRTGALVSLQCRDLPGRTETLAAIRLRNKPVGPVAAALWEAVSAVSGRLGPAASSSASAEGA